MKPASPPEPLYTFRYPEEGYRRPAAACTSRGIHSLLVALMVYDNGLNLMGVMCIVLG
jgi:hypothetical protein